MGTAKQASGGRLRHGALLAVVVGAFVVVGVVGAAGCLPPACSEGGDERAREDVARVAAHDDELGRAAADRLVADGTRAIALLETGLPNATPAGRIRLVHTMARIDAHNAAGNAAGNAACVAAPVLRHLAERDAEPDVRAAAERALAACASFSRTTHRTNP